MKKSLKKLLRSCCSWFGGAARALAVAAAIALAGAAQADIETWNDGMYTWSYNELTSGGVEIYKTSPGAAIDPKPTGTLKIPSQINGKPVTSIGSYAFYQCTGLEAVTIPDTVTHIGWGAFMGCSSLDEDVFVPDSVVSIEGKVFANCLALRTVSLPSRFIDVLGRDSDVFEGCDPVLEVMYHEKAGGVVWQFQTKDGVAQLSNNYHPVIPKTTAGHIDIPSWLGGCKVKSIGSRAFYQCSALTSVTMPEFVESIELEAFAGCSALKSVNFITPTYLTSIESEAFNGCTSLKHMPIPGLATIGSNAFNDCSALKTVHVFSGDTATVQPKLEASGLDTSGLEFKEDFGTINKQTVNGVEWSFKTNGEEAEIYGGSDSAIPLDTAGDVAVPATLGGCPVTRIGRGAFKDCEHITGVTLPASVTSIGRQAFDSCSSLRMTVPATVTSLADAFSGCDAMADAKGFVIVRGVLHHYAGSEDEVDVPEGVTRIGEYAFDHCGSLWHVTVPATVCSIGRAAFYQCTDLYVVTISGGLTFIEERAFGYCTSLDEVKFPSSVKRIGYEAFRGCGKLDTVEVPKSVRRIDDYAFADTVLAMVEVEPGDEARVKKMLQDSKLDTTGIIFSDGLDTSFEVEFDANYGDVSEASRNVASGAAVGALPTPTRTGWAFKGWYTEADEDEGILITPATVVTDDMTCYAHWMPEGTEMEVDEYGVEWQYRIVDGEAEIYNDEDEPAIPEATRGSITVPAMLGGCPVTRIGDYAFTDCSSLTGVTIPDTVTSIGNEAFWGCTGMADEDGFVIVRGVLYYYDGSATSLTIPAGVTEISGSAFYGCDKLTSVMIPDAVTAIGDRAFWGCKGMADDSGFVIVRDVLHYYAGSAAEVTIPNIVARIGSGAFVGKTSLTSVTIPPNVKSIDHDAFRNDTAWTTVHVVKGDKERVRQMIEDSGYDTAGLSFKEDLEGSIDEEGALKETVDGIVWCYRVNDAGEAEIYNDDEAAIPDATAGEITVPSTLGGHPVTRIGDFAFEDCDALTSVTIPDTVTSIGESAFEDCSALKYVNIPNGVTTIEDDTFSNTALEKVTIPDTVTSIGKWAFGKCRSMAKVSVPKTVKTIGEYAFCECTSLSALRLNEGLEVIGESAFSGCTALSAVVIPGSVVDIGKDAFQECTSLKDVVLQPGVKTIGGGAFCDCASLENVELPDGLESIGYKAFSGCQKLPSVNLPNSITSIWEYAFCECESLKSILIPPAVTSIKSRTFLNCSSLTNVTFAGGVEDIGDFAFTGCSGLTSMTIEYGVKLIGLSSFMNCRGMTEVSIPKSVEGIGEYAFQSCTELTTVYVSKGDKERVKEMLEKANLDTSGLTFVDMEYETWTDADGVNWTYRIVDGEAEIYNDGKPAVPYKTVEGKITVPSSLGGCPVVRIGDRAFYKCAALTGVTIPKGVTSIGDMTFWGCKGMADAEGFVKVRNVIYFYVGSDAEVTVPNGVTSIGVSAFYGHTTLTGVRIPASVTVIGEHAFDGTGLVTVYVEKGDKERVKGLFAGSYDDVDKVTFVEPSDIFTVTFDANGGTCADATRDVESGSAVGKLPSATYAGFTFDGWFTEKDAGSRIDASTVVTADVTFYAHWVSSHPAGDDPSAPGSGSGSGSGADSGSGAGSGSGSGSGAGSGSGTTPSGGSGYVFLSPSNIKAAYSAGKTLRGAVYSGYDVVGVVELKLGKVNIRRGTSKVSGYVTLLDGKRYTIRGVQGLVSAAAPLTVTLEVKKVGTMTVTIGGEKFAGSLGTWHVQSADVGGNWTKSGTTVSVGVDGISAFTGTVLADLLPNEVPVTAAGGKWKLARAASVKWAKPKRGAALPEIYNAASGKGLLVDVSKGANLSAMKLTYTPKKGTFKGSFKVYALEGEGNATKLKKYTFKVSGVVVEGVGYGQATCKRPAITWPVTVE